MDRNNSFQSWRGRRILTAVLLLLALGGTATMIAWAPRSYQAEGSVVLLASRAIAKSTGNNPYLSFSPSLTLTAEVLSGEMAAPGTVGFLAADGFDDPYTVALATYTTATSGSQLTITVSGRDRMSVERDLTGVMSEVEAKLAGLQSGLKPYNRIRAVTVAKSQHATLSISQTARPVTVVAAGGLLIALAVPWIIDAQLAGRQGRWSETENDFGDDDSWSQDETGPADTRVYRQLVSRDAGGPAAPREDRRL